MNTTFNVCGDHPERVRNGMGCARDFGKAYAKRHNKFPAWEAVDDHVKGFATFISAHRSNIRHAAREAAREVLFERTKAQMAERIASFEPYTALLAHFGIGQISGEAWHGNGDLFPNDDHEPGHALTVGMLHPVTRCGHVFDMQFEEWPDEDITPESVLRAISEGLTGDGGVFACKP